MSDLDPPILVPPSLPPPPSHARRFFWGGVGFFLGGRALTALFQAKATVDFEKFIELEDAPPVHFGEDPGYVQFHL